jgi:REP element-mobilizing transposase RayT
MTPHRRALAELTTEEINRRASARNELAYPPVSLDEPQIQGIGRGFEQIVNTCGYTVWACSILPEHTHLVIARHVYRSEQIMNLLKGAATTRFLDDGIHPLASFAPKGKRPPRMWESRGWKVYLDSEIAIDEAIHYVEQNPLKEGRPRQAWPFVKPFLGIETSGWVTYH